MTIPSPGICDRFLTDPRLFFDTVWPGEHEKLWRKQMDILKSVRDNYGTICHAGVGVGKTRIAARIVIWFYATRYPCKVIATSTSFGQLKDALWGEIGRALRDAKINLGIYAKETLELRRRDERGRQYEDDWVRLRTAKDVEGMAGIHLPTIDGLPTVMALIEEASGVTDKFCTTLEGQAHVILAISNPRRMAGYFLNKIQNGDQPDPLDPARLRWCIIHIDAELSPNVQAGKRWDAGGRAGPCPEPIPGLMTYADYLAHLREWDAYSVSTLLHGIPAPPGGALFKQDHFRYFREEQEQIGDDTRLQFVMRGADGQERRVWQDECWWFQTVDTAMKEGAANDYTVVLTACVTPQPACLLVVHVRRERLPVPEQFGMLLESRGRFPRVQVQAVEDAASGIGLIQEGRLRGIPFRAMKADRSKTERATAVLTAYQNGLVYHKSGEAWLATMEHEQLTFPGGEWDDQVDCLGMAGNLFQEHCYQAATANDELVCWPPREREEGEDDWEADAEHLSLAERLTGHRPRGTTRGGRGFDS